MKNNQFAATQRALIRADMLCRAILLLSILLTGCQVSEPPVTPTKLTAPKECTCTIVPGKSAPVVLVSSLDSNGIMSFNDVQLLDSVKTDRWTVVKCSSGDSTAWSSESSMSARQLNDPTSISWQAAVESPDKIALFSQHSSREEYNKRSEELTSLDSMYVNPTILSEVFSVRIVLRRHGKVLRKEVDGFEEKWTNDSLFTITINEIPATLGQRKLRTFNFDAQFLLKHATISMNITNSYELVSQRSDLASHGYTSRRKSIRPLYNPWATMSLKLLR